jgi:hypothetical protein
LFSKDLGADLRLGREEDRLSSLLAVDLLKHAAILCSIREDLTYATLPLSAEATENTGRQPFGDLVQRMDRTGNVNGATFKIPQYCNNYEPHVSQ